jgi:hypothetical protein
MAPQKEELEKLELEEDYRSELVAFGQRIKARREAGSYSQLPRLETKD